MMTSVPTGPTIPPHSNSPKVVDYSAFTLSIESSQRFFNMVKKAVDDNISGQFDLSANIFDEAKVTGIQPSGRKITPADLYLEGVSLARVIEVTRTGDEFAVSVKGKEVWKESVPKPNTLPVIDASFIDEIHSQDKLPELYLLHAAKKLHRLNGKQFSSLCALVEIAEIALPQTIYKIKRDANVERPNIDKDRILPMPNHQSWPGGHGYWAGNLAILISQSCDNTREKPFLTIAKRIGDNRERAGIHWPEDTTSGIMLGTNLMKELITYVANNPNDYPVFIELVRRVR